MGGFITSAARLARQNIRPLFLPTSLNSPPPPLKRVYDVAGTITSIIILNYTAAPFILLSARDSIYTWRLLGWYGHIIVMGGLACFYLGGTKYLKGLQRQKGILPPSKGVTHQTNGETPIQEKNFVLPPAVDSVVPPPEN